MKTCEPSTPIAELKLEIERECPSLTPEERTHFAASMIRNHELMKKISNNPRQTNET